MDKSLIYEARKRYHERLVSKGILTLDEGGVASNADRNNASSCRIAKNLAKLVGAGVGKKIEGQTLGTEFERITAEFMDESFALLQHIRPASWHVLRENENGEYMPLSAFEQYAHLEELDQRLREFPKLKAILGTDYFVKPDIIVYRDTLDDDTINSVGNVVDNESALLTMLRSRNGGKYLLHADISAKWTMRSDRAQNTRTEALNLIRNRKGYLPHIVCVTAEPQPSRLASLALGTGDIDCVYHAFLYELKQALEMSVAEGKDDDALDLLNTMIDGKRIKDISDLPLDLAV
jgi:hypothetical protein